MSSKLEKEIAAAVAERLAAVCGVVLQEELRGIREEVVLLRQALGVQAQTVMTYDQAAEYLSVSRSKIDSMVRSGVLRTARIGGTVRVRREWLDALVQVEPVAGAKLTESLLKRAG